MNQETDLAIRGGKKAIDFDLKNRFHFGKEEKDAVDRLFEKSILSGNAIGYNGPEENDFCQEFSVFLGGGYSDGVNSGTNAVFVALRALNLPPFSEVIVSPITDAGGIMPIVMNNCIPVIADAGRDSFNIDPNQIESIITPLTRAIVVAHIGGEPADSVKIMEIANRNHLFVIEDCAQSHGARINGRIVGTFGTYGAFSTMFGKHFCTGGQGGMVFSKTEDLYWKARRAADRGKPFGVEAKTNVSYSLNCNLDEFGATIGRVQLKKLPRIIAARQNFVNLLKSKGFEQLRAVSVPEVIANGEHVYWWWRLKYNAQAMRVSKKDYCAALSGEGVLLIEDYSSGFPSTFEWFRERWNQYPWNCPMYQGDRFQEFKLSNAVDSIASHFILRIYESWGEKEANAIMNAFQKVDEIFAK